MDDEILKLVAFIRISSYRTKALKELMDENKTPTQIAKDSGIRITHISNILRDLKDRDIAECINEEKRKNRIYRLTSKGQIIASYFKED